MHSILILFTTLSLLFAKDINHKVQSIKKDATISSFTRGENGSQFNESRASREDTTTIWFEDFEGDLSGWELATGWEFTSLDYYSPSTSLRFDDDNFNSFESALSPTYLLPAVDANFGSLHFSFAVFCDLPDFNGTEPDSGYLDDYYSIAVADMDNIPWNSGIWNAYDGNSYYCGVEGGGYLDDWLQFLDTPEISVSASGYTLTTMMKWGIESPTGASEDESCTDGWDAANVRISNDGGSTWSLLVGDDAYDFNYGYGWIYNDAEYDCGGSLENLAAGWAGQADWHEVTFDLSAYTGDNVIIRYAFGSDPAYSTPDDPTLTGLQLDDIQVTDANGVSVFLANADDNDEMTSAGLLWEEVLYEWGNPDGVDNDDDGELDYHVGAAGWDILGPGDPQSWMGNVEMNLTSMQGHNIRFKITGRADDNHDGGDGTGLHIDDIHVWQVDYNVIPTVQNLNINTDDSQVSLTWDMPPSESYDNDEVANDDGAPENSWAWGVATVKYGSVFDMPYGTESVVVHSASFFPNSEDDQPIMAEIEAYNVSSIGIPEMVPIYSTTATLEDETWTSVEFSNWTFAGDFLIALVVDSTVYMSIDEDATTAYSYIASPDFGSDDWFRINDLDIGGEWLIRSNVTTTGTAVEPGFNVYRDPGVDGSQWQLMMGSPVSTNEYVDNLLIENGTEYCYKVSAIYGTEESDQAGPVCATPESNSIYDIAYDDGSAETSYNFGTLNYFAVKFTPSGYPADLYRASFYTSGSTNGVGLVHVWDDDGENGSPGTILLEPLPITFVGNTWKYVSLSDFNITINDGSFYVGMQEMNPPPIGIDTDSPSTNSIINIDDGSGWEPLGNYFEGALMVRAELDSMNALGIDDGITGNIPESFGLKQNFPNPFNPTTTIEFDLASGAFASIVLYDVTGREVKTLVNSNLQAGHYVFDLNASELSSGMYFYKLTAQNFDGQMIFSSTKKMVLMK